MENGGVQVERFESTAGIRDAAELEVLFRDVAD